MKDQDLILRLKQIKTHFQHLDIQSDNYVMTADNYLKMCLIYLRVQSRVPVVIMGETGCGKTSLIKFFCKNVLCDRLKVFYIHAGITRQNIIEKMKSYILIAYNGLNENQNLWVFFDEFNTSEDLGIICEILTDRKLLGESLPDNMIFLAACNPYKLRSIKLFEENVGLKRSDARNRIAQNMLLYTVHPLPENVVEYVWDFGSLTENDYRRYIKEMVTKANVKEVKMVTDMILAANNYFKINEDSSSVSLRDVSRFIILYKWFV
jgi:E3 ubiquitin-protein ligase RNF213